MTATEQDVLLIYMFWIQSFHFEAGEIIMCTRIPDRGKRCRGPLQKMVDRTHAKQMRRGQGQGTFQWQIC